MRHTPSTICLTKGTFCRPLRKQLEKSHGYIHSGFLLQRADAEQTSGVYGGGSGGAGARDRGQHGDLYAGERVSDEASADPGAGSVGRLLQPRHQEAGRVPRLLLPELCRSARSQPGLYEPGGAQHGDGGVGRRQQYAARVCRYGVVKLLRDFRRAAVAGPGVHSGRGTAGQRGGGGDCQLPVLEKDRRRLEVPGENGAPNGRLFTVVGIAAEGFSGSTALLSPEVFVPLGVYESLVNDFAAQARPLSARDNHSLILIGRLRPGVSPAAADRQLVAVGTSMEQAYPAINKDQGLVVRPLSRMSISTSPQNDGVLAVPAALLLSMAAVVLLIASLNVANMMLARGTARRKEIAIRLALGGGRARIVQQLLTEGMLLAALGGLAGLAVSYWGTTLLTRSLAQLAPFDLLLSAVPDVRVLAATMGFCLLSTVLFGFGPAWNLSRPDLVSGLKAGDTTGALTGERGRLFSRRNLLVMTQVSLSLMLLTAAGLFVRSSMRAARIHPGFQLAGGILLEVDPSLAGYDEAHGRQVYRALLERLRGIPGVARVSIAATVPFGMISLGRSVQVGKAPAVAVTYNIVGDGYFE